MRPKFGSKFVPRKERSIDLTTCDEDTQHDGLSEISSTISTSDYYHIAPRHKKYDKLISPPTQNEDSEVPMEERSRSTQMRAMQQEALLRAARGEDVPRARRSCSASFIQPAPIVRSVQQTVQKTEITEITKTVKKTQKKRPAPVHGSDLADQLSSDLASDDGCQTPGSIAPPRKKSTSPSFFEETTTTTTVQTTTSSTTTTVTSTPVHSPTKSHSRKHVPLSAPEVNRALARSLQKRRDSSAGDIEFRPDNAYSTTRDPFFVFEESLGN